jgi:hypothetical protein
VLLLFAQVTTIIVTMLSYVAIGLVGLVGLVVFWLSTKLAALSRNIAAAKQSGLPYRISSKTVILLLV